MNDNLLLGVFSNIPLLGAFLAGFLSFLSPCVLPLIPAYMSYISNQSIQNLKHGLKTRSILPYTLLFVLGFGVVFMLVGVSLARIIHIVLPAYLKQASGIIIIIFGLHFLGILKLGFLYKTKTLNLSFKENSPYKNLLTPLILGITFSLGWTPCIGPIFTSIIFISSSQQNYGIFLMGSFVLGLAIPFIICALLFSKAIKAMNFLKAHMKKVEIISGILLTLLGISILTGFLDRISS